MPADIILLQTSEPQGVCYIETSNIDGETNLKIKEAVPGVAKACPTPTAVAAFRGVATYEHPNGSIYTFDGSLLEAGKGKDDAMPLGPNNMVLRGCTLRNTGWVLGLVVFSGVETKVRAVSTVPHCIFFSWFFKSALFRTLCTRWWVYFFHVCLLVARVD